MCDCQCFNSKLACCGIIAGILGVPTLLIHLGFWYHAYLVNEELQGSVETTCEIVQRSGSTCEYSSDDDDFTTYGLEFSARAYVDICSPMFNKTIPWKHVGLADNCYRRNEYEKSGLPIDNFYKGMSWPCRANCEKQRWYTSDFNGYTELTNFVFMIGVSLLIFSFLSCFFSFLSCQEVAIHCYGTRCYECCADIWCGLCNPKPKPRLRPKKIQLAPLHPRDARFVACIQGDWINSDGLQIFVNDRQVTFLPSGNKYSIEPLDSQRLGMFGVNQNLVSIRINNQVWRLCDFNTKNLETNPYFRKEIMWMSEDKMDYIKWSRRQEPKPARITAARTDRSARLDRLVESIQGDWSNSDGLLISVKNRQATFLPSGNSYKIDLWGTDQVSIRINDRIWSLISCDTSKQSKPHSRKTIYWRNSSETIKWSRRGDFQDVPPSYENAGLLPTFDQVELCVSAPPAHQNASAPPAYEMMGVNTAGAKKKLYPNSHEV